MFTFSYEIISIGGPLGCEGGATAPGLGAVPGLEGAVGCLGGANGTLAPPKFDPGPLGATKLGPDPPLALAFAGGK